MKTIKKYYRDHWIGWIGAFFILFGYYLNAGMNPNSWLVWVVGNTLVGFYCLSKNAYPTAVMSFMLVILNIYGYINWVKII